MSWIETYTGKRFDYLAPTLEMIDIRDIAHSLAHQCRYNGHSKKFYSVAEHCLQLLEYISYRQWPCDKSDRELMTLLMHDAAEAYLSDIPRPLKPLLPEYNALETRIEEVVAEKFDLIYPWPAWVKKLDRRILIDECIHVMESDPRGWGLDDRDKLGAEFLFHSPPCVERQFLAMYHLLSRAAG